MLFVLALDGLVKIAVKTCLALSLSLSLALRCLPQFVFVPRAPGYPRSNWRRSRSPRPPVGATGEGPGTLGTPVGTPPGTVAFQSSSSQRSSSQVRVCAGRRQETEPEPASPRASQPASPRARARASQPQSQPASQPQNQSQSQSQPAPEPETEPESASPRASQPASQPQSQSQSQSQSQPAPEPETEPEPELQLTKGASAPRVK